MSIHFSYFSTAILVLILGLFGCQQGNNSSVTNVIPEDQMVHIIEELQYIEALHNESNVVENREESKDTSAMVVFKHFQVSPSQFDSSIRYYSKNPIKMEEIMNKAQKNLQEKLTDALPKE